MAANTQKPMVYTAEFAFISYLPIITPTNAFNEEIKLTSHFSGIGLCEHWAMAPRRMQGQWR
jgi:hypothetical protein